MKLRRDGAGEQVTAKSGGLIKGIGKAALGSGKRKLATAATTAVVGGGALLGNVDLSQTDNIQGNQNNQTQAAVVSGENNSQQSFQGTAKEVVAGDKDSSVNTSVSITVPDVESDGEFVDTPAAPATVEDVENLRKNMQKAAQDAFDTLVGQINAETNKTNTALKREVAVIRNELSQVRSEKPPEGPKGDKGDKGEKGDRGDKGERGSSGQSVVGPAGRDGRNGLDGQDGISITGAQIDADGVLSITYSNGLTGLVGNVRGDAGPSGDSIQQAFINNEGSLIIQSTSGASFNAGAVKGSDGEQITAANINSSGQLVLTMGSGRTITAGSVKGEDGRSVSNITLDGSNRLTFVMSDGSVVNAGTIHTVQGAQGIQGNPGRNGVSISSANVDSYGDLIINLDNGNAFNAGRVKGEDGQDAGGVGGTTIYTYPNPYDPPRATNKRWIDGSVIYEKMFFVNLVTSSNPFSDKLPRPHNGYFKVTYSMADLERSSAVYRGEVPRSSTSSDNEWSVSFSIRPDNETLYLLPKSGLALKNVYMLIEYN